MKIHRIIFEELEKAPEELQQKAMLYVEAQLEMFGCQIDIRTLVKKVGWKKALFKACKAVKALKS